MAEENSGLAPLSSGSVLLELQTARNGESLVVRVVHDVTEGPQSRGCVCFVDTAVCQAQSVLESLCQTLPQ